jgi:hypothetical protein
MSGMPTYNGRPVALNAPVATPANLGNRRKTGHCHIPDGAIQETAIMSAPVETLREKLHSGVLPRERFVKTWRAPGTGKLCTVCELPITPIEHEVEGDRLDGGVMRFHPACYDAWWHERRAERRRSATG